MSNSDLQITVLGSGTSSGVPVIGCTCETCTSDDPRDKRLRVAIHIQNHDTSLIIDTGPDFRQQMLKYSVTAPDAVIYTHHHFDHIGGFDDIRAYNFLLRKKIPIYLLEETFEVLKRTFLYAFERPDFVGGGIPEVETHIISDQVFKIGSLEIIPIPLQHGPLRVNGYRIGNFAYCTDTNFISEASMKLLEGVEYLIIDGLRFEKHPSHFTIPEAVEIAKKIAPRNTFITHLAHNILHKKIERELPENVYLCYDGLIINSSFTL